MRLINISAIPHPSGNRIDLIWIHPDPTAYPNVRVIRGIGTHPVSFQPDTIADGYDVANVHIASPEDVILVGEKTSFLFRIEMRFRNELDQGALSAALRQMFLSEKILLSDTAAVSVEETRNKWQIADKAQKFLIIREEKGLAVYGGLSRVKDENLHSETVYYYTLFPYKEDATHHIFDRHNRIAAMSTASYNMAGQMYELLPKIYHRYDTVLPKSNRISESDQKKGMLRRFLDLPGSQLDLIYSFAKASLDLYNLEKVDGRLLPLLGQWIGWETDYNLEISKQRNDIRNAPAIYDTLGIIPTAEAFIKRISGWESRTKEYVHNIFITNRPERLNLWLCERNGSGTWKDHDEVFSLDFAYGGRPSAVKDGAGVIWLFYHTYKNKRWNVWFKTKSKGHDWTASKPFIRRRRHDRDPTAAIQTSTLWVFWETYNADHQIWQINYRKKKNGEWSDIKVFPNTAKERRSPWAVTDDQEGFWLFWFENDQDTWRLKYNRHDGNRWQLDIPTDFPENEGKYPEIGSEPFILFHRTAIDQKIWIFWNQKIFNSKLNKEHWAIAYRVKKSIDPSQSDWGPVITLPGSAAEDKDYHDRGIAPTLDNDGNIEAFWSSNRAGSWAIWHNKLNLTTGKWTMATQVVNSPFTCCDPLVLTDNDRVFLIYRSNRSMAHTTTAYGATKTLDHRYSGSTTVDTRNVDKVDLIDTFEDFLSYTLYTGQQTERQRRDLYFYNKVGFFITPKAGETVAEVLHKKTNLLNSLSLFVPVNIRGNVIVEPEKQRLVYKEKLDFSKTIIDEL